MGDVKEVKSHQGASKSELEYNLVVIYPEVSTKDKQGYCYEFHSLVRFMVEHRVFRWTARTEWCCPDPNYVYFKLPTPAVWVDWEGLYKLTTSRKNVFVLKKIGTEKVVILNRHFKPTWSN